MKINKLSIYEIIILNFICYNKLPDANIANSELKSK